MTADNQHESPADTGAKGKGHGKPNDDFGAAGASACTASMGASRDENGGTDPKRASRLSNVPPKYRDLYRRAYEGKSRKAAIRAHCLECVYWSADEVRRCTAPACALFEFRLGG